MQLARSHAARHSTSSYEKSPSSVVSRCPMPSFSRKYAMISSAPLIEHDKSAADLQHVLSDRPPVEQRIERNRRLHLGRRQIQHLRRRLIASATDIAFVLLKQMHHRQQRRPLLLVLRDQPLALRLEPLQQRRKVVLTLRHFEAWHHRSTSPKTGSSEPIMTTMSAIRFPGAMPLSACRLYMHGGRVRTRHGRLSPLQTM